jgi:uncharacterized protein
VYADVGEEQKFDVSESVQNIEDDDPHIISPLSFSVTFLKAKDRIEGNFQHIETDIMVTCPRCLGEYQQHIHIPFCSYSYFLFPDHISDEDKMDSFWVDLKNNQIDVSEALRDEILLQIDPFAPCTKDCQGICPLCGKNKNRDSCSCVEDNNKQIHDKPLAKLKDLNQAYAKKKR